MPRYKVLVGRGWPILEGPDGHIAFATGKVAKHEFDEVFESDDRAAADRPFGAHPTTAECEKAVQQGYLEPVAALVDLVLHVASCSSVLVPGSGCDSKCATLISEGPTAPADGIGSPIVDDPSSAERPFTKEGKASLKK
jgi:hypothetical protein